MILSQIDTFCAAAGAGDEITPQAFADETDVLLKLIDAEKTQSAISSAGAINNSPLSLTRRLADTAHGLSMETKT